MAGFVALAAGILVLGRAAQAQSSGQTVEPAPPSSNSPRPAAPPAGFHEHGGFYLRATIGPTALHASWKVAKTSDWSVAGTGFTAAVALGAAILPNLVVFAELTHSVASDPTRKINADPATKLTDYDVDLAGFGPGLAYYLVPVNLYFSGTLTFPKLTSSYNGVSGSEASGTDLYIVTNVGIGATLMVGKEWWASANWGLGVAGIVHLASMSATTEDARVTARALSLVLSATYN